MNIIIVGLVRTAILFAIGFYGIALPGLLGPFTSYAGYVTGILSLIFVFRNLVLEIRRMKTTNEALEEGERELGASKEESLRLDREK